jgi:hypothetical protein
MLGGQMAGGGVGVAVKEELILIHCTIDMEHAVSSALRAFAPLFVETVEKWRKICREIVEGRDAGSTGSGSGSAPQGKVPSQLTPGPQGPSGKGGPGYIKI